MLANCRCPYIDSRGVATLISECGGLRSLSITRMHSIITDDLIEEICPYLTSLTSIDVSWNGKMSDAGVKTIAGECYHLKTIKLVVRFRV